MTAVPYQKPNIPESFGLTIDQCRNASWAITADGQRYRGAAAMNLAVSVATGNEFPYRFYTLPVIQRAQNLVYGWIARHRQLFPSDTPYCKQYPEECR